MRGPAPLIRRATEGDIPAMLGLWKSMWDLHAQLDPRVGASPMAETVMASWFREHLEAERSAVVVAQEGKEVVGYALGIILENPPVVLQQFFGYISEVAVAEARRKSGIGGLLLDDLHAWFRSKGVPYVEVSVSVFNSAARGFWRRYGYRDFLERLRLDL